MFAWEHLLDMYLLEYIKVSRNFFVLEQVDLRRPLTKIDLLATRGAVGFSYVCIQ